MSHNNTLTEVAGATAQETAYLTLRRAAMIGAIEVGRAITIRGVAEKLGMSPTPVREALKRLCAERAFDLLENRRIVIPQMTAERFEELIELRIALETHAARRALPFISNKMIEQLTRLDDDADRAIVAGDHETTVIENQRFHAALYQANPEQQVMPMIESTWLQLGPYLRMAAVHAREPAKDYHKEAIAALERRDEKELAKAITSDIRSGAASCASIFYENRHNRAAG